MIQNRIFVVDAFARDLFKGNPAAVCPFSSFPEDRVMQNIAAENNLSETAFFHGDDGDYQLRWFTPEAEVDLCGHATLATAHVIFTEMEFTGSECRFQTRSGELKVGKNKDGSYTMDFPSDQLTPVDEPFNFIRGLGKQPLEILKGQSDYLLLFRNENEIKNLKPDFKLIRTLNARGIIVTAKGEGEYDFVSRFFGPAVGIDEDPVTGSAHTSLASFWSERLQKSKMKAIQLSQRTGEIIVEKRTNRVLLTGFCQTYSSGVLNQAIF